MPPASVATDGVAPPESSRFGLWPIAAAAMLSAEPLSEAARFTSAGDSASAEIAQATTTYDVAPTAPRATRVRRAGWVR